MHHSHSCEDGDSQWSIELEPYSFIYAEYALAGQRAFGKGNRTKIIDEASLENKLSGE